MDRVSLILLSRIQGITTIFNSFREALLVLHLVVLISKWYRFNFQWFIDLHSLVPQDEQRLYCNYMDFICTGLRYFKINRFVRDLQNGNANERGYPQYGGMGENTPFTKILWIKWVLTTSRPSEWSWQKVCNKNHLNLQAFFYNVISIHSTITVCISAPGVRSNQDMKSWIGIGTTLRIVNLYWYWNIE